MSEQRFAMRDQVASQAFGLDTTVIDELADVIDELADRLSAVAVARVIEVIRAEGLIARTGDQNDWFDAQEVARRLRVSREWVYEHAEELGASRIGSGPRPRLRFPPQVLDSPGGRPMSREAAPPIPAARGAWPVA